MRIYLIDQGFVIWSVVAQGMRSERTGIEMNARQTYHPNVGTKSVQSTIGEASMDNLADFWSTAPLWGSLIALIVIAIVFRRLVRSRTPATPTRVPDRSWAGTEGDNLDSSHIGGPIFVNPPEESAQLDAEKPPRGGEPASGPK